MKKSLDSIVNVVIGTAGHIDHGKSTLVERLTGIHPDRLPEEKERGLTIDLGFSRLTLRTGQRVGIIDVPGHERLIKNMVAGATGIDLVILVVAADDGVMPQTLEHLSIMELLGLKAGIVVITKTDVVDPDLLDLVREDLKESLRGTFLETAPIVDVSAVTGAGMERLLDAIHEGVAKTEPRDATGVFRMPIQRVFSAKGFGTVVTGVPLSGTTRVGELLEIVPSEARGRVRGIHAYGEPTDLARAGHSSAINLTDVEYRAVHRGMVLTEPGYFRPGKLFEARLRYLGSNRRPLLHQTMIRLHVGTAEVLGRVHLLESKSVEPGQQAYVQFRLDEEVAAAPGDRFILRLHSPLETIGGGEILGLSRWRLKAGKPYVSEIVRRKEEAIEDPDRRLLAEVESAGFDAVAERDLSTKSALHAAEARKRVEALVARGELRRASRSGLVISQRRLEEAEAETLRVAERYFRENPLRLFLEKPKLRQALRSGEVFFQDLVRSMLEKGLIAEESGNRLRFRDLGPRLGPEEEAIRDEIRAALRAEPFAPPSPTEMAARRGWEPARVHGVASLLEEQGEILKLAEEVYLHREAVEEARRRLKAHLEAHGSMTASDARSILGSTRKYMIPLLEHLDREGFTVRRGDLRELRSPER